MQVRSNQRTEKNLKKKSRGTGLVYQPTYVNKGTGERKAAFTWWIQYSVRGRRFRESSGSRNRTEAERLLRERLEAAAQGKPVGPRAGKATFERLAHILLDDYRVNTRPSLDRVEDALAICADFSTVSTRSTSRAIASRAIQAGDRSKVRLARRSTGNWRL